MFLRHSRYKIRAHKWCVCTSLFSANLFPTAASVRSDRSFCSIAPDSFWVWHLHFASPKTIPQFSPVKPARSEAVKNPGKELHLWWWAGSKFFADQRHTRSVFLSPSDFPLLWIRACCPARLLLHPDSH